MSETAVFDLLRATAKVNHDVDDDRWLAAAAARMDWTLLPAAAEAHGVAPLVNFHLTRAGVALPIETRQELLALALHHREANRTRFQLLEEVLSAFDRASIPALVLKGAALAHVLYPSTDLRPLSDLDLLVDPQDAQRAQAVLATLEFVGSSWLAGRRFAGHHHLPALTRFHDGHRVQVEIHVDALSRDTPGSLTTGRLRSAPRQFSVGTRTALTLGHADMLYHLCRHTAELTPLLRLIWVADVIGYATRYRDEIQWDSLARECPFVINALSLLHLLIPLPDRLLEHVKPADGNGLRGIGVSCRPLGDTLKWGRSVAAIWRDVLDPSDWWLRLYYAVDDNSSVRWCRNVTHPLQVSRWLTRRAGTRVRWWTRGLTSSGRRTEN